MASDRFIGLRFTVVRFGDHYCIDDGIEFTMDMPPRPVKPAAWMIDLRRARVRGE